MSQDFMDPEIFADFIIEAREHLESIEPNLLELEKAPDNLSLLNEIFRPMHSLKGASGFLGLTRINALAHKAENILDELRKGTMALNSEIMDVILSATDALRHMIDNLEANNSEGDTDIESIIATIDAIMSGTHTPAPAVSSPAAPVAAEAPQTPPSPAKDGGVRKRDPDAAEKWLNSLPRKDRYKLTAFGEAHLKDFMDEARDNTEQLSASLLALEENSDDPGELINDVFRYFHNIKGNSGIIGYAELNTLTHEAETLLNNVRKGELKLSLEVIDLLFLVVDMIETFIDRIDPPTGEVEPLDVRDLEEKLRQAAAGKPVEMPFETASAPVAQPENKGESISDEDRRSFDNTILQQKNSINEALEQLEADPSQRDVVDGLYRSIMTVQNSCKYMNFEEAKAYAALTANLVDQGRKSDVDFSIMVPILKQECAILFELVEKAVAQAQSVSVPPTPANSQPVSSANDSQGSEQKIAEQTAAPAPASESVAPASAPATRPAAVPSKAAPPKKEETHKGTSTIRVDHEKLDHLMNLIGELIINRNRYSMLARQLESNNNVDIGQVAQNLSETTYAMARISDDLQDTIMKVRMVPVSSVFSRFPRLVRDLSRKSGKDVELIMEGEETELDKSVVEVIGDPLVHLIRNSMDHGIEPESVRVANGKSPKGRVYLRAYHRGHSVAIEVEDDGKGIDPEKMREVAVKKGILSAEEARALDDQEAVELIFAPGFSSAEKITDISGRGVGMDVVRTNIKNLKGSVSTSTELGKGTRFTLSLPLTLAIIDALMVNLAGQVYAIPLDAVAETTKIDASRLTDVKGRKAVTLRGEVLGIVDLCELMNLPSCMKDQEVLSVVVIKDNERRMGLVVDSLLERQEIVIKPLGEYLGELKGISGATILGDGSVILILDPHEIYLMATSKAL